MRNSRLDKLSYLFAWLIVATFLAAILGVLVSVIARAF